MNPSLPVHGLAAVDLNAPGSYLTWSIFTISVANLPASSLAMARLGRPLTGAPMLAGLAALTGVERRHQDQARRLRDRPRLLQGCGICAVECPCEAIDMVPGEA